MFAVPYCRPVPPDAVSRPRVPDPHGDKPAVRPQLLVLLLFGEHIFGRGTVLFSGTVIDILGRLGFSHHATRSTLTRMVGRGLLHRQRSGRRMYFGLTPQAIAILADGQRRIWATDVVDDAWDGTWTLLCFSLPESWQRERHGLRSQLAWAGFGPMQGGLWIAPGRVEVRHIVGGLGLDAHVRVFRARADELTDVDQIVADAYDLDALAARYRDFVRRWDTGTGLPGADPLAARLILLGDWLHAIERDPRLPAQHLPAGWPAGPAQRTFRELAARLEEPAREVAAVLLNTLPDPTAGPAGQPVARPAGSGRQG
jgi:phenylacetic acid degradation operon negative regulatory protein